MSQLTTWLQQSLLHHQFHQKDRVIHGTLARFHQPKTQSVYALNQRLHSVYLGHACARDNGTPSPDKYNSLYFPCCSVFVAVSISYTIITSI